MTMIVQDKGKKKSKCIEVYAPIAPGEIQNKPEDKTGDGFECGKIKEFHFHWYKPNDKDHKIGHFKLGDTQYHIFEERDIKKKEDREKYEEKRKQYCCNAKQAIEERKRNPHGQLNCINCMALMWPRGNICGDFLNEC